MFSETNLYSPVVVFWASAQEAPFLVLPELTLESRNVQQLGSALLTIV